MPSSVFIPRLVLASLLTTTILFPSIHQPFLDSLYSNLRKSRLYQASTFETCWTVLNYILFESYHTIVYFHYPHLRLGVINNRSNYTQADMNSLKRPPKPPHGMRRPRHRIPEMITYISPLLLLDLTMIKKYPGAPLTEIAASGNYNYNLNNYPPHPYPNTTSPTISPSYLHPTVHNITLSSPLQLQRALPRSAPTSLTLTLQLLTSLLIYDLFFFLFHLSLHTLPLLRAYHVPHHTHTEMHPQVTNRLSPFERLGLVLLANFSLNVIHAHVLTRTLFVTLFTGLLVQIHSGLDLEWGYEKVLPRGWGTGAEVHARHHRDGEAGFAPFFTWWDWVYERVFVGRRNEEVGRAKVFKN